MLGGVLYPAMLILIAGTVQEELNLGQSSLRVVGESFLAKGE